MDFGGDNYNSDELDIATQKITAAKRFKLIFKTLMYFFVFLIYGILMLRFFLSCDSKLVEKVRFSDEVRELYNSDKDAFELYELHTPITFNVPRTLLLKNIVYTPQGEELELGIKFKKTLVDGVTDPVLEYKLVDSGGNEYEISSRISDSRYDHGFERISFSKVKIDIDRNITKRFDEGESVDLYRHNSYNEDDYEVNIEENEDPDNIKYKLYIYYKGERLRAFLIYDDDILISKRRFKP